MTNINKYINIYNNIFPSDNSDELKIKNSFNINFLSFGIFKSFNDIETTKQNIIKLLDAQYVIFPTNHFYHFESKSLKYLDKNKIVCLNYYLKDEILYKINEINKIIKSEESKYDKIKKRIKENLKLENLKSIYFLENIIEPNTIYRKIQFSTEETFLSFDSYSFKRIEYKLKTICQLLEKMGALNIDITYYNESEVKNNIEGSVVANNIELGTGISSEIKIKKRFEMHRIYEKKNQKNNLNLNIHELYKIIEKEQDFFIDKNQFLSDIDLKFLMNSRCLNINKKYDTILEFEYINSFEKKIINKANKLGFDIKMSSHSENKERLQLCVDFIDPYEDYECINGSNITPNKEGFFHLQKIIKIAHEKNKNNYLIIHSFFESYMKLMNENKKSLNVFFNKDIDLIKTHDHILNYNFTQNEIELLFYHYFEENMSFNSFEKFRNIFLKPIDNIFDFLLKNNYFNLKTIENNRNNFYQNILCKSKESLIFIELDKLIFISQQYHIITDFVLKLMNIINNGIDKLKNDILQKISIWKDYIINKKKYYKDLFPKLNEIIYNKSYYTSRQYNILIDNLYNDKEYNLDYRNLKYYKAGCTDRFKNCISCIPSYSIELEDNLFNNLETNNKLYENILNEYKESVENKLNKNIFGIVTGIQFDEIDIAYFLKNKMKKDFFSIFLKLKNIINLNFYENKCIENINLINECIKPKLSDIEQYDLLKDMIQNEKDILLFISISMLDYNINEEEQDIDKYFKKIEHNLFSSFELISNNIKNIVEQFFYDKNGFFTINLCDANIDYIKYHIIKNYKLNNVNDSDKITLLKIMCLFNSDYINFSEFTNEKSIIEIMQKYYKDLFKNYNEYNKDIHHDKIKKIKEKYSIDKVIQNYQKFKIFFTFENFKEDFIGIYGLINNVSKDNVSTCDVSKDNVSTGDVSKDNVSKDNVSTGDVSKDNVSTGDVSKDNVSTGDVSKDNVSTGDDLTDNVLTDSIYINNSLDSLDKELLYEISIDINSE